MKFLVILIALAAAGYFVYDRREGTNPEIIETPVYAELRVSAHVQSRDIDMVLFGEMASTEDCQQRSNLMWEKLITDCKECTMTLSSCKDNLEPRYRRLFDDAPIHSTYLSFKRGNRFERNGRMVIYGLTGEEANAACEIIKSKFKSHYEGAVTCITGRGS